MLTNFSVSTRITTWNEVVWRKSPPPVRADFKAQFSPQTSVTGAQAKKKQPHFSPKAPLDNSKWGIYKATHTPTRYGRYKRRSTPFVLRRCIRACPPVTASKVRKCPGRRAPKSYVACGTTSKHGRCKPRQNNRERRCRQLFVRNDDVSSCLYSRHSTVDILWQTQKRAWLVLNTYLSMCTFSSCRKKSRRMRQGDNTTTLATTEEVYG